MYIIIWLRSVYTTCNRRYARLYKMIYGTFLSRIQVYDLTCTSTNFSPSLISIPKSSSDPSHTGSSPSMSHDEKPFLSLPGNLLLMLNIDWFQPFTHTQYSVGVMYLVIQNLPRAIRFKPENIIIVSTIPGPKEPDYNRINNYLIPMVNDLQRLWIGVSVKVPQSVVRTKLIRAALSYISSDLPATRKLCGFYSYHATYGCSKCLKQFPRTFAASSDFSGFDRHQWPARSLIHYYAAERVKCANTRSNRQRADQEIGVRYSELLKLIF